MKKHFMKIAFVAVFATIAGYGVYASQKSEPLSNLTLANVEALASGEDGGSCKWEYDPDSHGCDRWICTSSGNGNSCTCGSVDH